nr:unnamed protein product [Digitaria exilis]
MGRVRGYPWSKGYRVGNPIYLFLVIRRISTFFSTSQAQPSPSPQFPNHLAGVDGLWCAAEPAPRTADSTVEPIHKEIEEHSRRQPGTMSIDGSSIDGGAADELFAGGRIRACSALVRSSSSCSSSQECRLQRQAAVVREGNEERPASQVFVRIPTLISIWILLQPIWP